MYYNEAFIPTLKETPADAEAISHKLILRAGLARKLASGLYSYLPLGLKVINKISAIVKEEMNRAGFQELLLPMVQPGDLWRETGRWDFYGKELLRFKDRNGRDYCLGPTHEEVITDLARNEIKSYRQMPLRIYQIQTKFRDEMRPRFGLLRGREFIMKDAYSFDVSPEAARISYQLMYDAYVRIFKRLGLNFRAVEADTGTIGGNFSHEFMILADTGEDTLVICKNCDYAANIERAEINDDSQDMSKVCPNIEKVLTPDKHTVEEVTEFLNVPASKLVKTLIFLADEKPIAVLVRGDREINEAKLKKFLKADKLELANAAKVQEITNASVGFAGPVGLTIPIYGDNELKHQNDYITGANENNTHFLHVDLNRDAKITNYADLRTICENDSCPRCRGVLEFMKGIEAGHIFMLGEKYSKPMGAVFLDEAGKQKTMTAGCYGIGISRLAAAAIEQEHDDKGIIFPPQIAPMDIILINLDPKNDDVTKTCDKIYNALVDDKLDVLYDNRIERPGVKFNEADLLGIPIQIIVGKKGLNEGVIECKDRKTGEKTDVPIQRFREDFQKFRKKVFAGWNVPEQENV